MNWFCNLCISTLLLYLSLLYDVGIKASKHNTDQQKMIHEPELIHMINLIKTKELNEIRFLKVEQEQLLLGCQNASINKKFNRKIQALKYYQHTIKLFAKSASRMLSVLYIGKVVAANWLWIVFIKLTAINQNIMKLDELCNDQNVNYIIGSFVNICIENKYINVKNVVTAPVSSIKHLLLNETTILLMEAELVVGTDNILLRLYRYENQFNIFDIFWAKDYLHARLIPRLRYFRHINWQPLNYTLGNIFNNVNLIWKHDIFLASQYFEGIKDTVSITIIYCVMRHILNYQENRWSPKFIHWSSENPNKTKQYIDNYLKNIVSSLLITLRIMNLEDDEFYQRIIFHLTFREDDINMAKFHQFLTSVKNKFENILKKYHIPFEPLYRYIESNVIQNIFIVNEQTLLYNSTVLKLYNYYFMGAITNFNFKIVNSFSSSEKVDWIDKFVF
ncbi:uncharacterized protein LOC126846876 isoform X2 [Adelges cooleyi]|uniref:uncharacterized protein LOC126846876 isoform X2 n=1 Tax=Adelges cooleyi TaxID=133065 RepID=UPI00218092B1|nr:uncharacterized protein LOC126846876 isoform X2 [Adelges cooleyi]